MVVCRGASAFLSDRSYENSLKKGRILQNEKETAGNFTDSVNAVLLSFARVGLRRSSGDGRKRYSGNGLEPVEYARRDQ